MVTEITKDILKIKGIPETLLSILLEDKFEKEVTEYFDVVKKWMNSETSVGLFIRGAAGTGKSTLGSYAVLQMLKSRKSAKRMSFIDLKTVVEASYGQVDQKLYQQRLIFIDNFTADMGRMGDRLEGFIKNCIDKKIRIVIAGELPNSAEFRSFIHSAFYPINLGNTDLRRRKLNEEFGVK